MCTGRCEALPCACAWSHHLPGRPADWRAQGLHQVHTSSTLWEALELSGATPILAARPNQRILTPTPTAVTRFCNFLAGPDYQRLEPPQEAPPSR